MFMLDIKRISWCYWLLTVLLLSGGLLGWRNGFVLAVGLTVVQLVHFVARERRLLAFPVQVRLSYLLLLCAALPESMRWLYWLPATGTWAQVLFGYCPLARMLSLLPWNRRQPMSLALVKHTFLAAPVRGSIHNRRNDNYLGNDPAGTTIRHRPVDVRVHAEFAAAIRDLPPERR